ncbi:MAG: site-specific integrase [Terriglobia bacterium]
MKNNAKQVAQRSGRQRPAADDRLATVAESPLSPTELSTQARAAAEEILIAGEAQNTRRSYASALRYWSAWTLARYGRRLALPVPVPMAIQFVVDHVARERRGETVCELPSSIDHALVKAGFKGATGPLKVTTVAHRLAVLSKIHQLRKLENPCESPDLRHLIARAKRAAAKRGETPRKVTAATREPLEAMLATCDETLEGVRDRAILLFAWASGGRRRSEVANARIEHLRPVRPDLYLYRLGYSKTNQAGQRSNKSAAEKPIRGRAAEALDRWLARSGLNTGSLFRRLWKDTLGPPLSPAAIAGVVKRRARKAGLDGDWAGHSLRSGFVTEAGRRRVPLGDVMALTEHRKVDTVLGYYQSGKLTESKASDLLSDELPADPVDDDIISR